MFFFLERLRCQSGCCILSSSAVFVNMSACPTAARGAFGGVSAGCRAWLVAAPGLWARSGRRGAAAVLRAQAPGPQGAAEAAGGGTLGGEVGRAQQGHGGQADDAAAPRRPPGKRTGWMNPDNTEVISEQLVQITVYTTSINLAKRPLSTATYSTDR